MKANPARLAAGAPVPAPGHRDATGPVTVLFRAHQLELVRLAMFMVNDLALVSCENFGRLDGGTFTPLPKLPSGGVAW